MPQSIYYQDQKKMISDAKFFGRFENLHLIARCRESFNILKSHFSSNQIHLAPDMAFLIGEVKPLSSPIYDVVFLSRNGEKAGRFKNIKVFEALMSKANLSYKILDWHDWSKYVPKGVATPSYGDFNLPNFRLDAANRILSLGKIVLSDRMHAIILGMLMGKHVVALDNIYDKFKRLHDTFLSNYTSTELNLDFANSYEEAVEKIQKSIHNID
jgi:exopolysaccharide biosynthesis predicted pyruvyltransferase EpsI